MKCVWSVNIFWLLKYYFIYVFGWAFFTYCRWVWSVACHGRKWWMCGKNTLLPTTASIWHQRYAVISFSSDKAWAYIVNESMNGIYFHPLCHFTLFISHTTPLCWAILFTFILHVCSLLIYFIFFLLLHLCYCFRHVAANVLCFWRPWCKASGVSVSTTFTSLTQVYSRGQRVWMTSR